MGNVQAAFRLLRQSGRRETLLCRSLSSLSRSCFGLLGTFSCLGCSPGRWTGFGWLSPAGIVLLKPHLAAALAGIEEIQRVELTTELAEPLHDPMELQGWKAQMPLADSVAVVVFLQAR